MYQTFAKFFFFNNTIKNEFNSSFSTFFDKFLLYSFSFSLFSFVRYFKKSLFKMGPKKKHHEHKHVR